jgi:hypothetical protein
MNVESPELVLAFYPNARGFAYVILEGSCSPVDWGMSDLPRIGKTQRCLRRLCLLLDRYKPDTLVLRRMSPGTHIGQSATIVQGMIDAAKKRNIPTTWISRKQIQEAFGQLSSPTRQVIAERLARDIPMFAPLLPPARKIWNGEDRRMGLFDAIALAITFLQTKGQQIG